MCSHATQFSWTQFSASQGQNQASANTKFMLCSNCSLVDLFINRTGTNTQFQNKCYGRTNTNTGKFLNTRILNCVENKCKSAFYL